MFFKKNIFRQPYAQVCFCLAFLFSGSVIGCLQEENPSPLERKLQEFVMGSSTWFQHVASQPTSQTPLTSNVNLENPEKAEKYGDFVELIPLHQSSR
jgi:hypothetical protein